MPRIATPHDYFEAVTLQQNLFSSLAFGDEPVAPIAATLSSSIVECEQYRTGRKIRVGRRQYASPTALILKHMK